jgi:hypothetical protein
MKTYETLDSDLYESDFDNELADELGSEALDGRQVTAILNYAVMHQMPYHLNSGNVDEYTGCDRSLRRTLHDMVDFKDQ